MNAEIEIIGANLPKAYTSAEGKYRSRNIAIGIYEIRISKYGFETVTISKEIIDDGDTTLDLELVASV